MSIIAKIKGLLTIVTVTLMIAFIAYTSQIFIIWPYLTTTFNLLQTICILVPLNFCIGMLFIHYFLACFTNPGSVPIRYTPRQQAYIEVKKSTHTPRFCKTCDNHKPPRTHHCSVCKRCVLKMDHHCPWVNNCIGYFNYCHFIRFIVFVDISSIYLFVLLCCRTNQIIKNLHNSVMIRSLEIGFLSVNLICLAIVMVTVGVLTGYHVYCITTNTTTIEGWEKGRSLTIKGMGRIQNVKKPYDQGLCKNISAVLGNHPMLWFMPIPMRGTGLDFPISLRYFDEEKQVERPLSVGTLGNDTTLKKMSSHETSSDRPTSFATFVSNTTTLV